MLVRLMLAATITAAVALPARAQGALGTSEPVDRLIGAALATPYAEAQLKRFADNVRKAGDAACLQAKALDEAALIARGRALLQRRGEQTMRILEENFDKAAYQAALTENGEADATAEMERLSQEPEVKAYLELYRPAQLAKVLDTILEQFDRHVLVGRIKLDPVAPIARGEPDLKENPIEAAEAAAQQYVDQHPSQSIERYLDLLDASAAARPKGFRLEAAAKLGPMQFFAGVVGDLAELCVGKRQR
jgi:hypothetical protein